MLEGIGLDTTMLWAAIGFSALGLGAGAYMFYRARPATESADVSDIVKSAPYHRVHNDLKIKSGS
ncbi:hypothetical protein [Ruegeria hyattellae]|uniref:hypothetical protein n=1 Tax=Ruegeria hyattellae TaxID=3233337 RepID=UPI00355B50B1